MNHASDNSTANELHYSIFGDDPDLFDLVEMFVEEIPERIDVLRDCLELQNWTGLQRLAHQLKGSAGSYGFGVVTPIAANLENNCQLADAEEQILDSASDLIDVLLRLRGGTAN